MSDCITVSTAPMPRVTSLFHKSRVTRDVRGIRSREQLRSDVQMEMVTEARGFRLDEDILTRRGMIDAHIQLKQESEKEKEMSCGIT